MVPLPPTPTPAISSTAPAAAASTGISSNGLVVTLMGSLNSLWAMWKKKKKTSSSSNKIKKTGENSTLAKSKKFLAKISDKATKTVENSSLAKSKKFLAKISEKATKTVENPSVAKSKEFLAKISDKATNFRRKKKGKNDEVALWQKEILMGDKCQPLDFSGVIYYDRNGKQLPEIPVKSPRASPFPSYLNGTSK